MLHVEAAGSSAAAPIPGAKPVPADANGEFASIFASAQRTARTEHSSLYERRGIASSVRQLKQSNDSLSKSAKRTDKAPPSRRSGTDKPSLSDRMRESAERVESKPDRTEAPSHPADKSSHESSHDDRANDAHTDSPQGKQDVSTDANDTGANNDTRTADRVEQKLDQSVRPQQNVSPQAVPFTIENVRNVEAPPIAPAPSTTGNAGASAETPGDNGGRSQAAVIPNVTATLSPKQPSDHQPDANGSANVNQPAAEKTADVVEKPVASIDFENLLDATARSRGQVIIARSEMAGIVNEKTPVFGGIRLDEAGSVKALADVVRATSNKVDSSMLLKLDPPELGQMRIDVRMHELTMTLRFETQTQAGHDALQSRMTDLRSALEQHGILVDHVQVDLRPPSTASNTPHDSQQQHHGNFGGDAQFAGSHGQSSDGREGFHPSPDSADAGATWTGIGLFENDTQDGITRSPGIQSRRVDLVA